MATMPKTRAQQTIADAHRRVRCGEISPEMAQALTAHAREEQANLIWQAALDAAQAGA
jgi:hypothetical protein